MLEQLLGGIKDAEKRAGIIIADAEAQAKSILDASAAEIEKINEHVLDVIISKNPRPVPPISDTTPDTEITVSKENLAAALKYVITQFNARFT